MVYWSVPQIEFDRQGGRAAANPVNKVQMAACILVTGHPFLPILYLPHLPPIFFPQISFKYILDLTGRGEHIAVLYFLVFFKYI